MFLILVVLTALVALVSFWLIYRKTKDIFHPLMFLVPMFLSLYVFLPLKLFNENALSTFFSDGELVYVQLINLLGVACVCLGCLFASRGSAGTHDYSERSSVMNKKLLAGAYVLGVVGVSAYLAGIINVGGLVEAYSLPYGGGWSDIGYVRELVLLCVPAITFIFVAKAGKKPTAFQWSSTGIFAAPLLLHGLLGARRGPLFLVLAVVFFSWYLTRCKRPRTLFFALAGFSVGVFLLFLVSNRGSFYVGSDWNFEEPLGQYLEASTGNEYIYGAGAILHAAKTGDYYWGHRYLAILFVRPVPRQLWPDKYEAVGMGSLEHNLGTGGAEFLWTLGWAGANGAAPGIVSDLWIEAWWFSLIVLFGIGWFYGRAWRAACFTNGFFGVAYVFMVSLSIFLVFQTLEAMLFRFLFMTIPAWVVWQWAAVHHYESAYMFKSTVSSGHKEGS